MVVSDIFYFHPYLKEESHFDEHIFQMGWFNHQLDMVEVDYILTPVSKCFPIDGLPLSWVMT